ncbi:MAG: hypothetical protein JWM25_847 [Thermoleophilia bacterium]|nr:hypothetical protein [Thermoleophilia bacterium]MCZ4496264.1 hypothetical protein [Thermoleophilia bacterium]
MAANSHTPTPDASDAEWASFLKGRGYVAASEPKPISNYKEFHGFWVPPRLGSPSKGGVASPTGRRRAADATGPQKSWYSVKTLSQLYWSDRKTFDQLSARLAEVVVLAADEEANQRVEEHRRLLEPAVEAGLLNQVEADKKLAAWAKSQKIKLPKA